MTQSPFAPGFSRPFQRLLAALLLLPFAILGADAPATALRLPKVFSSHMVLQRERPVVVWGWSAPGADVGVSLATAQATAKANDRGEWKVSLPAIPTPGPHTLTVKSQAQTASFDDILVGEVWLCSGQSNMEMGIAACKDGPAEIQAADYPNIRLLLVPNRWTPQPETDQAGTWKVCTPKTIAEDGWGGFSAAAFYFGRELHKTLGVPVGLIDATWGGTRIESWTPPEGFAGIPALAAEHERVQKGDPRTPLHQQRLDQALTATEEWLAKARKALAEKTLVPPMPAYPDDLQPPRDVQHPTALYNGMVHALCPFALRGAIWYQGESNSSEGMLYTERMKALIQGWRKIWGFNDLAFYFVQIAPFNYGGNPEIIGEFWEAQAAAQAIPGVGMAVINDIGDLKDIHPANKQEVGRRLALMALSRTYRQPNLVSSGPTFKSMTPETGRLRLRFDNIGGGLASRDGKPLSWFEIIDADEGGFVKADATIEGDSVLLSSPSVKQPVAMRFAWSMLAEPNLMNKEGLPAGAFRSGLVPKRDLLAMKVPEAKSFELVYDIDLTKLGANPAYEVNRAASISRPIDRIAYFLELTGNDRNTQFVYVSMDAFTQDAKLIGIPTAASKARFQQQVANGTVLSNVKGVTTGVGLKGLNLEFWPHNYAAANGGKVPNASDKLYDFGDETAEPEDGYGSMQVNNFEAGQTVFAVNHWREGARADIGIGNQGTNQPDWTFAANAGNYAARRLRVLVHYK
jgi:sialate O-acetylesterase